MLKVSPLTHTHYTQLVHMEAIYRHIGGGGSPVMSTLSTLCGICIAYCKYMRYLLTCGKKQTATGAVILCLATHVNLILETIFPRKEITDRSVARVFLGRCLMISYAYKEMVRVFEECAAASSGNESTQKAPISPRSIALLDTVLPPVPPFPFNRAPRGVSLAHGYRLPYR